MSVSTHLVPVSLIRHDEITLSTNTLTYAPYPPYPRTRSPAVTLDQKTKTALWVHAALRLRLRCTARQRAAERRVSAAQALRQAEAEALVSFNLTVAAARHILLLLRASRCHSAKTDESITPLRRDPSAKACAALRDLRLASSIQLKNNRFDSSQAWRAPLTCSIQRSYLSSVAIADQAQSMLRSLVLLLLCCKLNASCAVTLERCGMRIQDLKASLSSIV